MTAPLARLLGVRWPVIQAPMAGVQGSALAVAVSAAGGLGSLPAAMLDAQTLERELQTLRDSGLPYNVNVFCHATPPPDPQAETAWRRRLAPYYAELGLDPGAAPSGPGRLPFDAATAGLLARYEPPVVSFHFGLPAPELLARVKGWGAVVLSSATTVAEARWLAGHGADAVIAQGLEAGGHRGHFLSADLSEQLGTFALLPQLVDAVDVPVVAAGGIADAAAVRAALALGAAGVQAGTAYLRADEAATSALHRAALGSAAARHTTLTNVFTGRPARGIVNRLVRELGTPDGMDGLPGPHGAVGLCPDAPPFPLASNAVGPLRAAAEAAGSPDFTPLWCGQNVARSRAGSAAEITAALASGLTPD